jgi:hypothetical protein
MKINIENLKKLREFWIAQDDQSLLDMGDFAEDYDEAEDATPENPCKTCMCAVGSGPSAGIPFEEDETWVLYSERVFGLDSSQRRWNFLFSEMWTNDINQLVARLTLAIDGKIPKKWTYEDEY